MAWHDRHEREPMGSAIRHDDWANLLTYASTITDCVIDLRSAWVKSRLKRTNKKSDFNRTKTGAIIRELLSLCQEYTDDDRRAIANRFWKDRENARKVNKKKGKK